MGILDSIKAFNVLKVVLSVIGLLIPIIVSMLVYSMYHEQIDTFVDRKVHGKSPDVGISLTHIFEASDNDYGFLNLSQLSEGQYKFEVPPAFALQFTKTEKDITNTEVLIGGKVIHDTVVSLVTFEYKYKNGTVRKRECAFSFPVQGTIEAKSTHYYMIRYHDDYLVAKPDCENCFEKAIVASNFGNKKLTDFKADICMEGFIEHVSGDIVKKNDKCIQARTDNFLPNDVIEGTFYSKYGFGVESVEFYDELGFFNPNRYMEWVLIVISDCTTT